MRIVFIADQFIEDFIGGAELSLKTHVDSCPYQYIKVKCKELDLSLLDKDNDFLVFNNFFELTDANMREIIRNWGYAVIECDYKYCFYRSSHKHKHFRNVDCRCETTPRGLLIADFFKAAQHTFFKSERQRAEYFRLFPQMQGIANTIISGVFSAEELDYMLLLRKQKKGNKYFVLKTNSWIKGYEDSVAYCEKNNLSYVEVGNMPYLKSLKIMAQCKGIAYFPRGFDVSCRMITEAKILGLDIRTNDLIQHMTEEWFNADFNIMLQFLYSRAPLFWETIIEVINARVPA